MHSERGNNSTRLECCWRYCDLVVIAVSASFARLFPTFFKERNEGQIEAEVLLDGAARPLQVKDVELENAELKQLKKKLVVLSMSVECTFTGSVCRLPRPESSKMRSASRKMR